MRPNVPGLLILSRADVARLVRGPRPGRRDAHEISLFDPTGLGLQDAAVVAYRQE
jgi:ornithine cyclodeaminase/alanine dehydrogenase-like protein (mu-crystallin family)